MLYDHIKSMALGPKCTGPEIAQYVVGIKDAHALWSASKSRNGETVPSLEQAVTNNTDANTLLKDILANLPTTIKDEVVTGWRNTKTEPGAKKIGDILTRLDAIARDRGLTPKTGSVAALKSTKEPTIPPTNPGGGNGGSVNNINPNGASGTVQGDPAGQKKAVHCGGRGHFHKHHILQIEWATSQNCELHHASTTWGTCSGCSGYHALKCKGKLVPCPSTLGDQKPVGVRCTHRYKDSELPPNITPPTTKNATQTGTTPVVTAKAPAAGHRQRVAGASRPG